MKGFRDFLMRGNLLELAVAFIMGAAFTDVTKTFTAIVMDILAKIMGGTPDFSGVTIAGVNVGMFIMALVAFLLTAAILYFGLIKPLSILREKLAKKEEEPAELPAQTQLEVLTEIRDLLATR